MDGTVVVKVVMPEESLPQGIEGEARLYRKIDFRRNQKDISGRIITIEYDPNRNAYICLIHYFWGDGEQRYILHPRGLEILLFLVQKFLYQWEMPYL